MTWIFPISIHLVWAYGNVDCVVIEEFRSLIFYLFFFMLPEKGIKTCNIEGAKTDNFQTALSCFYTEFLYRIFLPFQNIIHNMNKAELKQMSMT